jgi:hypothetical protein
MAATAASTDSAGTSLTVTFSDPVTRGTAHADSDWTLNATNGNPTLTYSSGDGTTSHDYTISRTIQSDETLTLDYTQPGDGIEDDPAGNDLATFSGQAVSNNSTQDTPTAGSVVTTIAGVVQTNASGVRSTQ